MLGVWRILSNFAHCKRLLAAAGKIGMQLYYWAMKMSVVLRFVIIGCLWIAVCAWFVTRLMASGTELTLMSLFPVVASGVIVFVPLYKKYVRDGGNRKK